ncbi:MAG TPA: serine hydrolase [Bacillota bacterium]|nr:serine hydrolase [Bacillota bacterium]
MDTLEQLAAGYSGQVGFFAKDVTSGASIGLAPDTLLPTASCIKVMILMELVRREDISLDQRVPLRPEDQVGGSGVLKDLTPGIELPLHDVAMLMIVLSDNTATNMLIDLLGLDAINRTIAGMGLTATRLHRPVNFTAIGNDIRGFAESTPREFATSLELIATGRWVSEGACATILDMMGRQLYTDLLPRYLTFLPYARAQGRTDILRIANKTGFSGGVRGDTAIFFYPHTTVVAAAFAEKSADRTMAAEAEPARLLGRIGQVIDERFRP